MGPNFFDRFNVLANAIADWSSFLVPWTRPTLPLNFWPFNAKKSVTADASNDSSIDWGGWRDPDTKNLSINLPLKFTTDHYLVDNSIDLVLAPRTLPLTAGQVMERPMEGFLHPGSFR
jgi:hypothetical protein